MPLFLRPTLLFRWVVCVCLLLGTERLHAQGRDSIFFYNGQMLIGEVRGANMGELTIDDIDLKIQSVKLYKIKRLRTYRRYKIELVDKRILYGFITPSDNNGRVLIQVDSSGSIETTLTNIFLLIPMEKNFFRRLDGNLSAGFTYAKSSSIGQLSFNSNVMFASRSFSMQLTASEIASIDSSEFSRDNENLQLFGMYDITPTLFATSAAQYQRNLELGIGRRYLQMIGAGYKLFIRTKWQLLGLSGINFSQEKSTDGIASGLLIEFPLTLRFNFYQFSHPKIQISSVQNFYIGLTETGRVRYDGVTTFSWEMIRYFYFDINPYTNFDNRPPSGSNSTFDFGITFSISYRF